MRVLVLLLALFPAAAAAPLSVTTYHETFDSFDPNIWFIQPDGGIDCEVANGGCSLFLVGNSRAEGALPAVASPIGLFSMDVLRAGGGAGQSTLELTLERAWIATTFTDVGIAFSSSSDPGATSLVVIAPGEWHRIEIQLEPFAATLRLVDATGATIETLGPVAVDRSAGVIRTIGITGNDIVEAHHFDNVRLQVSV